jgi:predicted methyltransferase
MEPLLTFAVQSALLAARRAGYSSVRCSLDLGRSTVTAAIEPDAWGWQDRRYPYPETLKERTVYYWSGEAFTPITRFSRSLTKLVPTEWGPPTFEIDGIKMLPTARVSPYADAQQKVALVEPRGKRLLDTCGGLGYFAGCSLAAGAREVLSFEHDPDVIWLRSFNPWSPDHRWTQAPAGLTLKCANALAEIAALPAHCMDAVLHDPPRFGIAGDLYSQHFYHQLARVLRIGGSLFHYVGSPNRLTSGRDVPHEVARRLQRAGFTLEFRGDGILARRSGRP